MIALRIVTPYGLYKETETSILNVVTTGGELGILPSHVPVVAMLKISKMSTVENGNRELYALAGGMLYFQRDKATIVTDAVENVSEIDAERAEAAKERAEKRLNSGDENIDMKRAELALKKAINRLNIKSSGAR